MSISNNDKENDMSISNNNKANEPFISAEVSSKLPV